MRRARLVLAALLTTLLVFAGAPASNAYPGEIELVYTHTTMERRGPYWDTWRVVFEMCVTNWYDVYVRDRADVPHKTGTEIGDYIHCSSVWSL